MVFTRFFVNVKAGSPYVGPTALILDLVITDTLRAAFSGCPPLVGVL